MTSSPRRSILFLQSQEFFGSDSEMHANIMRNLDRDRWDVHVALGHRQEQILHPTLPVFEAMSDITIRYTDFGPQRPELAAGRWWTNALAVLRTLVDAVALVAYVWRKRIRIVHGSEKPRDAVFAAVLGLLTPARSVIHIHGKWGTWMTPDARWGLRTVDGVLAISHFVRTSVIELAGIPPERCHVVVNSIEPANWDPERDPAPVRREFGIGDDEVLIGIFARMAVTKGHLELARALAMLPADATRFKVLVVGTDDTRIAPDQPPLSEVLIPLLAELGLTDRFVFTGWRTDIPDLMAAIDVYAMPSFEEGAGLVFLEAMAMAKPVVALDSGGVPEIVVDEETGLLAPVGDVEALSERLARLIDDPELRARMGAAGRERVVRDLNAGEMTRSAEVAYDAVLARPRRWWRVR